MNDNLSEWLKKHVVSKTKLDKLLAPQTEVTDDYYENLDVAPRNKKRTDIVDPVTNSKNQVCCPTTTVHKRLQELFYGDLITNRDVLYKTIKREIKEGKVEGEVTYHGVIKPFLRNQEVNQLFRPYNKPAHSLRRVWNGRVHKTGVYLQIDLACMKAYDKKSNNNRSYILLAVDLGSRRLYLRSMPDKSETTTLQALMDVIKESEEWEPHKENNVKVKVVQSDNGAEFKNKAFREVFAGPNENKYPKQVFSHVYKPTTQGNVERNVGSLKRKLYRYFYLFKTQKWLPFLQHYAETYNNTPHTELDNDTPNERSVKMLKSDWRPKPPNLDKLEGKTLEVGDNVRIIKRDRVLLKDYKTPFWSKRLFKIVKIMLPGPNKKRHSYYVDIDGKVSAFTSDELQKIDCVCKKPPQYDLTTYQKTHENMSKEIEYSIPQQPQTRYQKEIQMSEKSPDFYNVEEIIDLIPKTDNIKVRWKPTILKNNKSGRAQLAMLDKRYEKDIQSVVKSGKGPNSIITVTWNPGWVKKDQLQLNDKDEIIDPNLRRQYENLKRNLSKVSKFSQFIMSTLDHGV